MLKFTACVNGEAFCSFERETVKEAIELTKRIIEEDQLNPAEVTLYFFNSDEMILLDEVKEETNKIIKALNFAGYDCEPTESELTECFRDYVASGIWSNLDLEEVDDMIAANELTVNQMCNALIKYCKRSA